MSQNPPEAFGTSGDASAQQYAAPEARWAPPTVPPGYPQHRLSAPAPPPGRVSAWVWPLVCGLALGIGLLSGAIGGLVSAQWLDELGSGSGLEETVTGAPLPADNNSVAAVAAELLPSTVQVLAVAPSAANSATGSGFVLDRRGHIVTNNHVVAGATGEDGRIEIVDHEGNHHRARLVGRSPVYDLAVLFVREARQLRAAALGASRQLRVGEEVVAFGSPLGLTSTVTAGIVSAVNRPVTTGDGTDEASYINAVQTDAAINPGNSGGPLVNLAGQVVGVNSAIATTGQGASGQAGNIGVGFAIPIEQVRVTADQILRDGEARYPVIGATVSMRPSDDVGARIDGVPSGTPAATAGLRSGDLITEINGERVVDGIALIVAIRTHQPGDTVQLTVRREGEEQTLEITLDSKVG